MRTIKIWRITISQENEKEFEPKKIKFWQATFFYDGKKYFSEKLFLTKNEVNAYAKLIAEQDKRVTNWDIHQVEYEDYKDILK